MITLYARLEPTTDDVILKQYPEQAKKKFDVQTYKDKECTIPFARFPWHHKDKPTKRNKYVTLNCYKWRLKWV